MPLQPGTRLGPYEIVNSLGAGGMGEVYRARDLKLQREVAIKVLPEIFASDPERLSRFEREAQSLAALNHPNIAHVYGVIEQPPALAMELVEGEDLSQRLARGPIPVDEAVPMARQVCDALAAAHDRGIVHRDLKPANIKVRLDGTVKVLDFGLAKLAAPADGDASAVMNSPTFTSPATQLGVILGTAAYMAPEQAKGREVDRRADVWAFGVVLFEMLTGRRVFEGEATTEVLASVLKEQPRWGELPPATPASVRRLLRRCLQKDPRHRLRDIADARLELDDAAADEAQVERRRPSSAAAMVAAAVAGALIVAAVWAAVTWTRNPEAASGVRRLTVLPPRGEPLAADSSEHAISPDGRAIVFTAGDNDRRLWLRTLDASAPRPLSGTEGGMLPFWSPDGRRIGYFANGKLSTISLENMSVMTVCNAPHGRGGTWNKAGVIVFAPAGAGPLMQVGADGGEPRPATALDASKGETAHRFPWFLPNGRDFLYVSVPARERRFDVFAGSTDSLERKPILRAGSAAVYSPSGHVIFARDGALMAQSFDVERLVVSGEPRPLGDTVLTIGRDWTGGRAASVSATGALSYVSTEFPNTRLAWFDVATGRELGTVDVPPGAYHDLRISPDGRRAVSVRPTSGSEINLWLIDLERGGAVPLTSGPGEKVHPQWSPDSTRVAFTSTASGKQDLYVVPVSGRGGIETLFESPASFKTMSSWSPDGRYVVFSQLAAETRQDLWFVPVDGERKAQRYLATAADEFDGQVSPDGRWMAYRSDETGRSEIYVQPFPTPGEKHAITTAGTDGGVWANGGRQYAYASGDQIFVVDVTTTPRFSVSAPRVIGKARRDTVSAYPTADLKRLLASVPMEAAAPDSLTIVLDWTAVLKRR